MNLCLGVDVGAISIKGVLMLPDAESSLLAPELRERLELQQVASTRRQAATLWRLPTRRTRGQPLQAARELLSDLLASVPGQVQVAILFTGAGGKTIAQALHTQACNEFQACARAIGELLPQVRTVFEMGGETSRYLRLNPDPASGRLSIVDYGTNGDCAAGTGSFLDQQAGRLNYRVEEIGEVVATAARAAQIAGRCSVFAKSDMIHAQQKGFQPPEVLRGLCNAVATNFKAAVVKGRPVEPPVAFIGGVAANRAVTAALKEAFELKDDELIVPDWPDVIGAVGAALLACERHDLPARSAARWAAYLTAATRSDGQAFPTVPPLTLERVRLLRDRVRPYQLPDTGQVDAWLGLDIGSVGTKLVLIDDNGDVIYSIFTRTEGRPIAVVARGLREIEQAVGDRVRVRGVGSTGSGRELIGELVGADSITDEITCHKTGAVFVGDRLLGRRPDTIFEIGGQDSKYISLQEETTDGRPETIVVDFTMNEACAAGTGSFLEERAAELGVSIKDEFARLAFSSRAPLRLGERCTVFMERDVNTYLQRGAKLEDIIAGLAYSVAWNYINRVVRGRHIGNCVFFQGGTAYNDAVAAAFSVICNREIIVPPYNALLGAIGAALLAREKIIRTGTQTRFRGYNLDQVDYSFREFTCKGCGNRCAIQEFNVCGEKTYWGDKCSDRYRKQAKTDRKPVIPDLLALRHKLLAEDDVGDPSGPRGTIGIPLAMYSWDFLPLWRRFFRDCGFAVALSDPTSRPTVELGLDCVVAEPCFPIIVAHGHVAQLVARGVDFIWLPNLLTAAEKHPELESYVCPWGSTLPFVVRQAPAFRRWYDRILCPTISLQRGTDHFREQMVQVAQRLGVPTRVAGRAFESALAAQQRFRSAYEAAGREALETLIRTGEPGMVLVGRPYNIHDAGVNLAIGRKLRELYGVNVLPIDCLPLAGIDVSDVNDNMYWAYGRRILAAAKLVARHPNLHIIYITNFKCGPDSFIKSFIRPASGKPFLTLQFDGHSNDAGMMTRAEAYLDSKGILRWWRKCATVPAPAQLPEEPSTSRRWPMPARVC